MIDYFAIGLSHALIFIVCWRLLTRDDLDDGTITPPDAQGAGPTMLSAGARHREAIKMQAEMGEGDA